ncbi:CR032 protein, partial [Upupa epops]|nr:CR032 protein [Upupa epops]
MVCIPCIVIPILLWVYKKFLEPYIYPVIAPFVKRVWPKKAVEEVRDEKRGVLGVKSLLTTFSFQLESNGIANGVTAQRTTEVADKK